MVNRFLRHAGKFAADHRCASLRSGLWYQSKRDRICFWQSITGILNVYLLCHRLEVFIVIDIDRVASWRQSTENEFSIVVSSCDDLARSQRGEPDSNPCMDGHSS